MEKKNHFPHTFGSVALCILLGIAFVSVVGLAHASSKEERRREEEYNKKALEEARETQQRFPEAYRAVCVPAALGQGRSLDQYYLHLAPKGLLGEPLNGLEAMAAKAADGYAYAADSRYARLLHLLRAQPLAQSDSGIQAVLQVLRGLAEDESRVGADDAGDAGDVGDDVAVDAADDADDSLVKSGGTNDCARFAALLSDAGSFMNAPGNLPVNIAVSANIMEGAFADSVNYVLASPLWKSCGDEMLHIKATDLLILSQKEARAKQGGGSYGTGIRYDPLMRAYHTGMTRIADPDRRAVWYAESVAYHAGKTFTGSELSESLRWMLRFEPTGTYAAGKKILDDFNDRYRDVRKAGIYGHTGNVYDAYPAYRTTLSMPKPGMNAPWRPCCRPCATTARPWSGTGFSLKPRSPSFWANTKRA